MTTATKTKVMVELSPGYGDGYGIVLVDEANRPVVNPGIKNPRYRDCPDWPMEQWKRTILRQRTITLVDGLVNVPLGAVRRVIGPLDCPESMRVRLRRYTKNWDNNSFVDTCTDDDLRSLFAGGDEPSLYSACVAMKAKYQESR